jgi:capsular exopolysaccharide synthesis family protein
MHEMVPLDVEQTYVPAPAAVPTLVDDAFPSAPSLEMSGAIRDEIAKLVQKLFLVPQGARRVVFSGTEADSGCSWLCARVALLLAQRGQGSVCLVDANLRSPGLHQQFGMENHHGLSDAIVGSGPLREYTHRLSKDLWLLSCGSSPHNALTMLGSERINSRLSELRAAFDYVLVDAPPLNACNDAVILGGLCDGVVLALKANSSRRETARKAVAELQNANVRVLGAVLNERTFPIPEALYKKL